MATKKWFGITMMYFALAFQTLQANCLCPLATSRCAGRKSWIRRNGAKLQAELAARHLVCQYDPCLSDEYGGIPLMNRELYKGSRFESRVQHMIESPGWKEAFEASLNATEQLETAWDRLYPSRLNITRMREYDEIYEFFMNHYNDHLPAEMEERFKFWTRDNETDPMLTIDQRWDNDEIFAQSRLIGVNPVQIERVTLGAGLQGVSLLHLIQTLNTSGFEWDKAVHNATGLPTMAEAARLHRLFVVRYPLLAKVHADSRARGAYSNRAMMSPIALFASSHSDRKPLKPVAIQLGHTASSPVYTPQSNYFWWTVSKMYVSNADGLTSQIVHHLVNAHLVSEVFAVSAFRNMLPKHPVHDLLLPHFQGLVGINTEGFRLLTSLNGAITEVAGFGHSGLLQLVKLAYEDWTFEKMNFTLDLERRGMSTSHHHQRQSINGTVLPGRYPYRDDGMLVFNVLKDYVGDYLNHFYCADEDVKSDSQLQAWAKEISAMHKNKSFPSSIISLQQLKDILLSIIWTNTAHHAAINYPVKEFGSHIPTIAYTLFKKPSDWNKIDVEQVTKYNNNILTELLPPTYKMAKTQAATATQLASLRFRDLLSHWQYPHDYPPGSFVHNNTYCHYQKLRGSSPVSVQSQLTRKNRERRRMGLLPYRYMQPKNLPNSTPI